MRIEQLIGSYSGMQSKHQGKSFQSSYTRKPDSKGKVLDIVCLTSEELEQDLEWFGAYIRQIPDDVVTEKIRQLFFDPAKSPDEFLVEKILFEYF